MLFNSLQFVVFFGLVLAVYHSVPIRMRGAWLLITSLLFYSLWVPAYLILLVGNIVVNYALLKLIVRSARPRLFVTMSIVFTFGLLAYFKYAAFILSSAAPALAPIMGPLPELNLVLPIGISFYSFQIVALAIDAYRGRVGRIDSLARYALFVCFFPQLIAGPILRGHEFLPQLERGGAPSSALTQRGLWLIAAGVAKKIILADFMLAPFVDEAWTAPFRGSTPHHLVAAYSFAFQIYFDFSGYTDMARGMACLLGFELPLNFREPYLSRDPSEFWRRWHMTLSNWLRDYLYIPLGGNRGTARRVYFNLFITMLLGGLWHGAGWTFVIWGALHGVFLIAHRLLGGRHDPERPIALGDTLRIVLWFHGTCLLWVFFRAPSLDEAVSFLSATVTAGRLAELPILQLLVVGACGLLHLAERLVRLNLKTIQEALAHRTWGAVAEGLALGTILAIAFWTAGAGGQFIYFQF